MLVSVFTRCTPLNWGTLGYNNLKIKEILGRCCKSEMVPIFTQEKFDVND